MSRAEPAKVEGGRIDWKVGQLSAAADIQGDTLSAVKHIKSWMMGDSDLKGENPHPQC